MLFGTNTSVGLKVGTGIDQVPSILIGYDRQEAVIMPLVANTTDHSAAGLNRLSPCNIEQTVQVVGNSARQFPVHPCLLVATNGASTDSYSVLASFGGSASARAGGQTKAGGSVAQYFATGLAAQMLAATGGAAVVSAAADPPADTNAAQSLFLTVEERNRAIEQVQNFETFKTRLTAHLQTLTDTAAVAFISSFEDQVGINLLSQPGLCTDKGNCISRLELYAGAYNADWNEKLSALITTPEGQ